MKSQTFLRNVGLIAWSIGAGFTLAIVSSLPLASPSEDAAILRLMYPAWLVLLVTFGVLTGAVWVVCFILMGMSRIQELRSYGVIALSLGAFTLGNSLLLALPVRWFVWPSIGGGLLLIILSTIQSRPLDPHGVTE